MQTEDWEVQAHERRCVHCSRESCGTLYAGRDYLRALQGFRGGEAVRLARHVDPFFWSDADVMHIKLCEDCAAELGLGAAAGEPAPSTSQSDLRAAEATGRAADS